MKSNLIAAATAILFSAVAAPAFAADGTITFKGESTEATCTVTGEGADSAAKDFTVTLPTIQRAAFAAAGQVAGARSVCST